MLCVCLERKSCFLQKVGAMMNRLLFCLAFLFWFLLNCLLLLLEEDPRKREFGSRWRETESALKIARHGCGGRAGCPWA